MAELVLTSLPLEQLKTEISEAVLKEISTLLQSVQGPTKNAEFLTRKEAAKLLGISLVTLNTWTKEGKVSGYRIASRVRYKREDLVNALSEIKCRG